MNLLFEHKRAKKYFNKDYSLGHSLSTFYNLVNFLNNIINYDNTVSNTETLNFN